MGAVSRSKIAVSPAIRETAGQLALTHRYDLSHHDAAVLTGMGFDSSASHERNVESFRESYATILREECDYQGLVGKKVRPQDVKTLLETTAEQLAIKTAAKFESGEEQNIDFINLNSATSTFAEIVSTLDDEFRAVIDGITTPKD